MGCYGVRGDDVEVKNKFIILPNTERCWNRGISLSLYSRSYDFHSEKHEFTELGRMVHDYKYESRISSRDRNLIVTTCGDRAVDAIMLEKDLSRLEFNCYVPIPGNRGSTHSLSEDLADELTRRIDLDCSYRDILSKNRKIRVLKNMTALEREIELRDAYGVKPGVSTTGLKGFLVIDDIYDTGATVREVSRTLKRAFPEIPRYVLTVTHLRSVWTQPR